MQQLQSAFCVTDPPLLLLELFNTCALYTCLVTQSGIMQYLEQEVKNFSYSRLVFTYVSAKAERKKIELALSPSFDAW